MAAAFATVLGLLCVSTSVIAQQGTQVLTVSSAPSGREGQVFIEWLKEVVAAFEASHPGVQIKLVEIITQAYEEKIPALAAVGELPDVFYVSQRYRTSWIRWGIIADVTPFLTKDQSVLAGFLPPLRSAVHYQGRYWGLPRFFDTWTAFVNRDVFDQAGLQQPDQYYRAGQWSFDLLPQIGRKLTKRDSNGTATQIGLYTAGDNETTLPWVWGFGGEVFSSDGMKISLTDPDVRRGCQFFLDLLHTHRVASINGLPGGLSRDDWRAGKWGIAIWWTNLMGYLKPSWKAPHAFDLLPFPAGPQSDKTNLLNVDSWSISPRAQNKQLAWEFLKFVTDPQSERKRMAILHALPLNMKNLSDLPSLRQGDDYSNLPLLFEALATKGRTYTSVLDPSLTVGLTNQLLPVWRGEKPLQEALKQGEAVLTSAIQEVLNKEKVGRNQ